MIRIKDDPLVANSVLGLYLLLKRTEDVHPVFWQLAYRLHMLRREDNHCSSVHGRDEVWRVMLGELGGT